MRLATLHRTPVPVDDRTMLELRPICEHCATELPAASAEAMICAYECTFCRTCVDEVLGNVCPNCAGGFVPRPIRPAQPWRDGVTLANFPATHDRVHKPVDALRHAELRERVGGLEPPER